MGEIQFKGEQRQVVTRVPPGCSLVKTEHLNALFAKAHAYQPSLSGDASVQENNRANSQATAFLKACVGVVLLLTGVSCITGSLKPDPVLPAPIIIQQTPAPAPAASTPTGNNQNCESDCRNFSVF